jgi:diguanylate cyclase (GGDEF)-like protein/PAS domain S-box-containing protein
MSQETDSKATILVVDDLPENLHLLFQELSNLGYEVRCVVNGQMALMVAQATAIDLILLDIKMPGMDGYEVCQQLKKNPQTQDIPVIFLSALDEPLDKVKAFSVGGIDYVTKPFQILEVLARVETHISLRQAQLQLKQFNQELEERVQQRTQELALTNQNLAAEIKVRQEVEARYRLIADNMSDLVCLYGDNGQFLYVSPSCEIVLGYSQEEMMQFHLTDLCHPEDLEIIELHFEAPIMSGESISSCYRVRCKSGKYIWLETLAKPLVNEVGQVINLVTNSRNVTQRIKVEKQLRHDALHDILTGLPNRNWLFKSLEMAFLRCKRGGNCNFALLMVDLDRFKSINESLGHLLGDKLLIAVAQTLQKCIRDVDIVARLGGDEFVILLDSIDDLGDVIEVADRIKKVLEKPFEIEGNSIFTSASIGINLSSEHYQNGTEMLRDADIAMYRAKELGRNRYEVFDYQMYLEAIRLLNLENDLRFGIKERSFIPYYQPIICLNTGNLLGFEALVRWQHPQGLVMPGEFIDLAEDTGLIKYIGQQMLEKVCQQVKLWEAQFDLPEHFRVSVNVSGEQFKDLNFINSIDQILQDTGLNSKRLKLEITERILLKFSDNIFNILSDIRAKNIDLAIDDFGTGYSSLRYLSQFPVNTLKIDRSFVNQMETGNTGIVQAIIDIAHNLQMDLVAEGVESSSQLDQLKSLGCEAAQGYFFAKPLTPDDTTEFLGESFTF